MNNIQDYIGCDETGVGDFYGPIVFVAAYIPVKNIQKIIDLGVKDSKKITDKKIMEIAPKLMELSIYRKSALSQQGNNKLAKFLNTNEVKLLYHFKNINAMEKEINKDSFIDQFSTLLSIEKYKTKLLKTSLDFKIPENNVLYETKAEDKILSVAVASIIARYLFLQAMSIQNEKYKVIFPLGASNKNIAFGKEFVKIYGKDELYNVAKANFKTIDEIIGSESK
ncbi:ribonuclease HIII [Mycoplasma phocoenae]|nr:ribonuclease HIII [Mycoplasma phocoenae]